MAELLPQDQNFINRITEIILTNLGNENFSVEDLAREAGMKYYKLSIRLRSINNMTVNQFIREVRLMKALGMLKDESLTIAEVAYKTGFSSPTYFNKCFHEFFGYPPGTVKKGDPYDLGINVLTKVSNENTASKSSWKIYYRSLHMRVLLFLLVGSVGFLIYTRIHNSLRKDELVSSDGTISIAVMPFRNMTNDSIWNVWQEGIQSSLITSLAQAQVLKVRQSESVGTLLKSKGFKDYARLTPVVEQDLSMKLNAGFFINGSIIESGKSMRLVSQIFDTKKEEVLKSFEISGPADEGKIFTIIDSLSKQISNYLLISILKKEEPYSEHYPQVPDVSPEAYRYSAYGSIAVTKADWTTALEMFTKALKIDSTIGEQGVYAAVTGMYLNLGMYKQAKEWCLRGYKELDKMNLWMKLTMNYLHAQIFQTPNDAITYAEQLLEIDNQLPSGYWKLGDIYYYLFQWDKAIPEFEKVLEIFNKWDSKPYFVYHYAELGIAYHETGNYKKERKLYKKAQKDFPDDPEITDQYAILALSEGDTTEANRWIRNFMSKRKEQSWSEARLANYNGIIYSRGGYKDKAEQYYRRAIRLESENPQWIHSLANFLIDKDRNIIEGLELEETLLKSFPENYRYLDAKGWGLYKQGRYKEALESLQKSWDLRMKNAIYDHNSYLHLEEAKKAISKRL